MVQFRAGFWQSFKSLPIWFVAPIIKPLSIT